MIIKHLKTGWNDELFEHKIQSIITTFKEDGLDLIDIKIDSRGNDTLLIFE